MKTQVVTTDLPEQVANQLHTALIHAADWVYPQNGAQMAAFPLHIEPLIATLDPHHVRHCGSLRDTWDNLNNIYSNSDTYEFSIAKFHAAVGIATTLTQSGRYLKAILATGDTSDSSNIQSSPFFNPRYDYSPIEKKVFVLMPFLEEWSTRLWKDHIKKYVISAGYTCSRADDLYGHDVMEDIYHQIVVSQLVIGDISSRNANVMYEIGICHAMDKDILLLTQDVNDIPFDLLRFRHCIYSDNSDGYRTLNAFIQSSLENRNDPPKINSDK